MEYKNPGRPLLDAFLWCLVGIMTILVVWTSVKAPTGPFPISDKVLHYLAYTGLTFSMLLAAVWAPVRGPGRFPTTAIPLVAIAILFGVAIEVVQAPLPERDADLLDALANAGGALTALTMWTILRLSFAPRPSPRS